MQHLAQAIQSGMNIAHLDLAYNWEVWDQLKKALDLVNMFSGEEMELETWKNISPVSLAEDSEVVEWVQGSLWHV